jgi:hypothetical protein
LNVDCLSCASLANDDDASDEEDLESEWSYPDESSSSEVDDSDDDDSIDSGGNDDTSSSTDISGSSSTSADDSDDENKPLYEENDWELVGLLVLQSRPAIGCACFYHFMMLIDESQWNHTNTLHVMSLSNSGYTLLLSACL